MVEVVNLYTCKDWGRPGDILIDRKTKWGNPFVMYHEEQRNSVCESYKTWLDLQLKSKSLNLQDLKNAKRLGCHCKPKRCHGDYLKELIEKNQSFQQSLNL
jgi:leucyl-tRNA synthetase